MATKKKAVKEEVKEMVNEKVVEEGKTNVGVVYEIRRTMHISKPFVYHVFHKGAKVRVKNEGFGDVYVTSEGVPAIGNMEQLIATGQEREFDGVDKLVFLSTSQPTVLVQEIK